MPYTITVSEDKKYIVTKSVGGVNNNTAKQQNIAAQAVGFEYNIDRFLVDLIESSYEGTILDQYEFTYRKTMTEDQYNRYARIAILVNPDDHSHDFIETVGRNAGFNITIFCDRDAAIQHLIHDL
jgi:hypothetical protein